MDMSNLLKIMACALAVIFVTESCKKDDDESKDNSPNYSERQALLIRNKWKLTGKIWIDGREGDMNLVECKRDDFEAYISADSFTRNLGDSICSTDTFFKGTEKNFYWTLEDNETTIIRQRVDGVMDTSTLMSVDSNYMIRRTLQPNGTTFIDFEYLNY